MLSDMEYNEFGIKAWEVVSIVVGTITEDNRHNSFTTETLFAFICGTSLMSTIKFNNPCNLKFIFFQRLVAS